MSDPLPRAEDPQQDLVEEIRMELEAIQVQMKDLRKAMELLRRLVQ